MSNVISLQQYKEENTPHITGPAFCLSCKHEVIAVAPVGTNFMDCTACGLRKVVFKHPVLRGEGLWTCHCGCNLFQISTEAVVYCPNCGQDQTGWE